MAQEALFYLSSDDRSVHCRLCGHRCQIKPGRKGRCGVRENRDGVLYSLVYGNLVAENIDPVEKKPLFHFLPGSLTFSIATGGCNFHCLHCQNHAISQTKDPDRLFHQNRAPEEVVAAALKVRCRSISYTYVEPTIFFEFAYDCCRLAHQNNIKNIFVSNGFMMQEPAEKLVGVLDAINIDIKSFNDDFYREVCGGYLSLVLENVKFFRKQGVWVEITTLLIPGLNDQDGEIRSIAEFIAGVDPDIPWHISAFRPGYRMLDRPSTSAGRLLTARKIGLETGVRYVYVGNIRGQGGEDTHCPYCERTIIRRAGFQVTRNNLAAGFCPQCNRRIAGVWD